MITGFIHTRHDSTLWKKTSRGILFVVFLLPLVNAVGGESCEDACVHDRQPLELLSDGSTFNVRSAEDFKQALFVDSVTHIYLLNNITVTEDGWKDFVVPEVRRKVLVSPHEALAAQGLKPAINTNGIDARVKVGEGGHIVFEGIYSEDLGESRSVKGSTRSIPFLDISAGAAVSFQNVTFKTEKTCSTYGLEGFAENLRGMCKIPDCDIATEETTNTVVVGKAEMGNELTEFQGRYAMYDSILICGKKDTGDWKTKAVADEEHEVSSLIEIVTLLGNLPTNKFIVANITEDIEFVDLFFPEDGFVITRQRLLLDGDRGSSRSKITLKDGLGQVFYLIFNGRLEIANMDVIIDNCGLREAREFSAEGDHRLPIEEQLRDPAYGSEWGYFIPIEFINSPPTPDSRTTLKNTRVVCKTCGPISFTNYGQALMKSNITKFEDLAPDLGYRAKSDVDGIPVSASFPVRYKANEKNLIKRTSANTITIEYLEVVSPFDVFATSVALELVNVTLECEQIEKDPERCPGNDIVEAQSRSFSSPYVHPTVALLAACVLLGFAI